MHADIFGVIKKTTYLTVKLKDYEMKTIPSAALAISLSLFSGYPMAIDDTIEFIGDINNNICAISVNDGTTVNVISVQVSSMKKQ